LLSQSSINSVQSSEHRRINPWILWTVFFSSALVFVSLWIIVNPLWHVIISVITIFVLWIKSPNPFKTLMFVMGLVLFLVVLQVLFSPFMRELFLRSMGDGFFWKDWQYLMFAVERFAWPLVMVSAFQSKLSSPVIISQLALLFSPLKWLGLKIDKLQLLIMLALRFMPALKREWQRFAHFQTYFMTALPRKTILQKLQYGQGVLKAMISHTIHSAVKTGDLLALRGLPLNTGLLLGQNMFIPMALWLAMGTLVYFLDLRLMYLWMTATIWMSLVPLASRRASST